MATKKKKATRVAKKKDAARKAPAKRPAGKKAAPRRAAGKAPARAKAKKAPAIARNGKAPSFRGLALKEAAAAIFARLDHSGHEPILTGQACAAIYGGGGIRSHALEFVIRDFTSQQINALMAELGFALKEMRTYANPVCPFEVVIAPTPLAVGDDVVADARVIKTSGGPLRMLTPTDCVRQRLSMFYRWGDRAALAEAVQVARRQPVDLDLVKRWSEWEWATDRFQEFLRAAGLSAP